MNAEARLEAAERYEGEEQRLAAEMRQERDDALELLQAAEAQVAALRESITYCTCPEGADAAVCSQCGKPDSDDTVGQLRAQVAALARDRDEAEGLWATTQFPEFIEYWFTIGRTCSAGDAIRQLMDEKQAAEAALADTRRALEEIWNVPPGEHLNRARDIARDALAATSGGTHSTLPDWDESGKSTQASPAGGGTGQEKQP